MCYQLWPVSSSDLTVCSCNTMAHYLEPPSHTHTHNGAASSHQISGDWPLPHPEATSLLLWANQSGGLAESVMWNRGSWLDTSNPGHSWRPTETTVVVLHALSLSQSLLTFFLTPQNHLLHTHTITHTQVYSALHRHTPLRTFLCLEGIYTVDCSHGLITMWTGLVSV